MINRTEELRKSVKKGLSASAAFALRAKRGGGLEKQGCWGGGRQARGTCAEAVGQERPWYAEGAVTKPAWWPHSEGGKKVQQVAEGRQPSGSHLTSLQELGSRILDLTFSAGNSTDILLFCHMGGEGTK